MEICLYPIMLALNFMGQICCWYTFFNWCGCIEGEREEIQTQRPPPYKEPNPFVISGIPKNTHLQSCYT